MSYRLRRATVADTGKIWSLLRETIVWLQSLGTDQWSTWTTWSGPNGKVTRAISAGSVWLLFDGSRLVATLTVEPYGDPDFWTTTERAEPALYVSKLAVRRTHAGRGIGALLLEWTRDLARQSEANWVRLDAWRTNRQLRTYYVDHGWHFVRDVDHPGRKSGALFQLPAAPLPVAKAQALRLTDVTTARRPRARRAKRHHPRWRPRQR
jgi:GNAT superfamily N-acetyltransferase